MGRDGEGSGLVGELKAGLNNHSDLKSRAVPSNLI